MTERVNDRTPTPRTEPSRDAQAAAQTSRRRDERRESAAQKGAHEARPEPKRSRDAAPSASARAQRDDGRQNAQGGRPGAQNTRASSKRWRRGPCIAALDLGTNNCRILIARAEGQGFQVVDAFSRVVRLGEGLAETGRLSEEAMDRAVHALKICADRIRKHRVTRFRAIATEACRRASNCDEFLARVEDYTGLKLDVIDTAEEARLAVAGCGPLIDPVSEHLVVFDIGGGSTELIHVDLSKAPQSKRKALLMALSHGDSRSERARAAGRHIANWVSAPVGVVTLGERFSDLHGHERFLAMSEHVTELITPFTEQAGFADRSASMLQKTQLLGASGTITTLAGVHLGLDRYERHRVDGLWVAPRQIDAIIDRLTAMTHRERASIPCIGADRATNLMSGAAILRAILRAAPAPRLRVADRGLREGVLYGLAEDGRTRPRRRRRNRSE